MNRMRWGAGVSITSCCILAAVLQPLQAAEIAGLTPSVRPADAPKITAYAKDAQWYARALSGVSQPYPASLRFLEDQGGWFQPFIHAGMTGPYDIRGWHQPNNQ